MKSDVLRHGNFPADYARRERNSRPDRVLDQNNLPLNPLVGWSIALLARLGSGGASRSQSPHYFQ